MAEHAHKELELHEKREAALAKVGTRAMFVDGFVKKFESRLISKLRFIRKMSRRNIRKILNLLGTFKKCSSTIKLQRVKNML